MTTTPGSAAGSGYWVLLLARAVPAAVLALVITFSADHSVTLGAISLAAFGISTGILLLIGSTRTLSGSPRRLFGIQGVVTIVGGALALAALGAGLPFLLFLTSALFAVTGVLELVSGLRARGTLTVARDWIIAGAVSVVFAVAVLFIPVDLSVVITIPDKVVPNLTASVVLVGMLGAYAAVIAVFLVIAGLSLRWSVEPEHAGPVATGGKA